MGDATQTNRGTRRRAASLLGAGSLVAAVLALGVFAYRVRPHFDGQRWKSAAGELVDSPRAAMVNDLGRNHLRVGMTRQEVLDLLGRPDGEGSGGELIYSIGRVGFGGDSSEYVVVLGGDDLVISWRFDQY